MSQRLKYVKVWQATENQIWKKKTVVEKKAEYPSKLEENENMSENKKQCKGRLYVVFTNILERK